MILAAALPNLTYCVKSKERQQLQLSKKPNTDKHTLPDICFIFLSADNLFCTYLVLENGLQGQCKAPGFHIGLKNLLNVASGCDSIGRAVASKTRSPRFEFTHRQKF